MARITIDKFVDEGYSQGSIIPLIYQNTDLINYHPPQNSDPIKFRLKSELFDGDTKLKLIADETTGWLTKQLELFKILRFIENSSDKSSLISNQSTILSVNFKLVKSIITKVHNPPGAAQYYLEKLSWEYIVRGVVKDRFNTYWFWKPHP